VPVLRVVRSKRPGLDNHTAALGLDVHRAATWPPRDHDLHRHLGVAFFRHVVSHAPVATPGTPSPIGVGARKRAPTPPPEKGVGRRRSEAPLAWCSRGTTPFPVTRRGYRGQGVAPRETLPNPFTRGGQRGYSARGAFGGGGERV